MEMNAFSFVISVIVIVACLLLLCCYRDNPEIDGRYQKGRMKQYRTSKGRLLHLHRLYGARVTNLEETKEYILPDLQGIAADQLLDVRTRAKITEDLNNLLIRISKD